MLTTDELLKLGFSRHHFAETLVLGKVLMDPDPQAGCWVMSFDGSQYDIYTIYDLLILAAFHHIRLDQKIVFVAAPYTHPLPEVRHARMVYAADYTRFLMSKGVWAYCPLAHGHTVDKTNIASTGWPVNNLILRICNEMHILTLPGWDESEGVRFETELARRFDIPVVGVSHLGS